MYVLIYGNIKGGIYLFDKGEIILTNYHINMSISITYTNMVINQSSVEYFEDYVVLLQDEFVGFIDFIDESMMLIGQFLKDKQNGENERKYIDGLCETFDLTQKKFQEKGMLLKEEVIHTLAIKKVNSISYKKFKYILDIHLEMAEEMIMKELNFNRVEMILNYIREVIGYIKRDFAVADLPNAQILLSKTDFEPQRVSVSYDLSDNRMGA